VTFGKIRIKKAYFYRAVFFNLQIKIPIESGLPVFLLYRGTWRILVSQGVAYAIKNTDFPTFPILPKRKLN